MVKRAAGTPTIIAFFAVICVHLRFLFLLTLLMIIKNIRGDNSGTDLKVCKLNQAIAVK